MSFSVLLSGYLLIGATVCAIIYTFGKHFFRRWYKVISLFTAAMVLLFGVFLLDKVEYFPARQHLSYYRQLQGASDSRLSSKETLIFLNGCQFHLIYNDDPTIIYRYDYIIGKGMQCTVKSTSGGSAYLSMLYPPRSGYVTLP